MAYNPISYQNAFQIINKRRNDAINLSIQRTAELEEKSERFKKIKSDLRKIGASIAATFYSDNPEADIERLSKKSIELQEEKAGLLNLYGYDESYLNPDYTCKLCNDEGRKNGELCACAKELIAKLELERLEKIAPVAKCNFETFSTDYYKGLTDENGNSTEQEMIENFEFLKDYAEDFSIKSCNLFMFGRTGLGKTHLALAIAKVAIEKYYYVVYGTANSIFTGLEREKFKDDTSSFTQNQLEEADLVIIDDLGSEFSSSFTQAALHNLIETRLLAEKPTIITTNLDISGIKSKYGERIASRIIGEYEPIRFEGKDIRQKKRFSY